MDPDIWDTLYNNIVISRIICHIQPAASGAASAVFSPSGTSAEVIPYIFFLHMLFFFLFCRLLLRDHAQAAISWH